MDVTRLVQIKEWNTKVVVYYYYYYFFFFGVKNMSDPIITNYFTIFLQNINIAKLLLVFI